MTQILRVVSVVLLVLGVAGCTMPREKQMEQENASLRQSLDQHKQLLDQSQTAQKKQQAVLTACQDKLTGLEKRLADVELLKVQLQKQKEFLETELTKNKAEIQKQTALADNYHVQVETLNRQLAEARAVIGQLQKRIDEISKKPTTQPNSGPFEK